MEKVDCYSTLELYRRVATCQAHAFTTSEDGEQPLLMCHRTRHARQIESTARTGQIRCLEMSSGFINTAVLGGTCTRTSHPRNLMGTLQRRVFPCGHRSRKTRCVSWNCEPTLDCPRWDDRLGGRSGSKYYSKNVGGDRRANRPPQPCGVP